MQIKRTARNLLTAAALAGAALVLAPAPQAHAAVFLSVGIAPPPIPVYDQPLCPGDGYIWTPGYWAWGPDGYYWVDGAWVLPPYEDALWTPGWWGWGGAAYIWHPGYWGQTVGYYGGINYGFGYFGTGFYGGYWNGGHFFYNTAYVHVGPSFHGAVYNRTYSGFNGRPGGESFNAHPPAQYTAAHGTEAFRSSAVNGTPRGTEAFPNRPDNGFANREAPDNHAQQGFANRSVVNNDNHVQSYGQVNRGAEPAYNRGQNFGGSQQPSYQHSAPQNFGGAQPNVNRSPEPTYNRQQNFSQPSRAPQPSFNRQPAPAAGNFSHAQSAPAPSGGNFHGGGGYSGGGGGQHGHR